MSAPKVLIVDDVPAIREIALFYFESFGDFKFLEANNGEEALKVFAENTDISLVFSDFNMNPGNGSFLLQELRKNSQVPFILHTSDSLTEHPEMLSHAHLYHAEKPLDVEGLSKITKQALQQSQTLPVIKPYIPVNLSLLTLMKTLHCSLFVHLGDSKYVKTHHPGSEFTIEDSHKYLHRKIYNLYIEQKDFSLFIAEFQKFATQSLDVKNVAALSHLTASSLDMIKCVQDEIGLTQEVETMTRQNIDLVLKMADSMNNLTGLVDIFSKVEGSGFSQHCIMTAMIATSVGKKLNWISDQTSLKLAYAALLHDSDLPLSLWEKFEKPKAQNDSFQVSEEDKKIYHDHPLVAAETAKRWRQCPPDVDTILLQHHEGPDSLGFPMKLQAHRISALSVVFIISHHLALDLIASNGQLHLPEWLGKNQNLYAHGDFKKVFQALG